MIVLLCYNSYY